VVPAFQNQTGEWTMYALPDTGEEWWCHMDGVTWFLPSTAEEKGWSRSCTAVPHHFFWCNEITGAYFHPEQRPQYRNPAAEDTAAAAIRVLMGLTLNSRGEWEVGQAEDSKEEEAEDLTPVPLGVRPLTFFTASEGWSPLSGRDPVLVSDDSVNDSELPPLEDSPSRGSEPRFQNEDDAEVVALAPEREAALNLDTTPMCTICYEPMCMNDASFPDWCTRCLTSFPDPISSDEEFPDSRSRGDYYEGEWPTTIRGKAKGKGGGGNRRNGEW